MLESILENELSNLVHGRPDVLTGVLAVGIFVAIVKWIISNSKLLDFLISRKHKKIERKMKQLDFVKSFNNPNLTGMIEDEILDDLFTYNTGLNFRGIMREKFTEIYPRLRQEFRPNALRVIHNNIDLKDKKIVVKSRGKMIAANIWYFFYFGTLFLLVLGTFVLTYVDNTSPRLVSVFLFAFLLTITGFIAHRILVVTLTSKLRKALASLDVTEDR